MTIESPSTLMSMARAWRDRDTSRPSTRPQRANIAAAALELLHPRPHFDFPAPGTAMLHQGAPVDLGDGVGIEEAVGIVGRIRTLGAANAAVDHEMRDMEALRRQLE